MLRSIVSVSAVSALAVTGLMATTSPANAAAFNRCGSAYSDVSKAQNLYFDNTPSIQKFRVRFVPNTHKMCVEFLDPNPNFVTNGHVIRIKDTKNSPAAMICGGLVCKWNSDDSRAHVEVTLQAAPTTDPHNWTEMSGGVVVKFV